MTLFAVLLAAFNVLLYLYTGKQDLVVGSNFVARSKAGFESLIGFLVNTVVLRNSVSGDITFHDLLGQVWHTILDAHANSIMPLQELVKQFQPERQANRSPFFQIMFVLQEKAPWPIVGEYWTCESLEVVSTGSKYDITLYMQDTGRSIIGSFEYNKDLFDRTTIELLCDRFNLVLEEVSQTPDKAIDQLVLNIKGDYASGFYS